MAGAADGVAYLYENVGVGTTTSNQAGVEYLYENIGLGPRWNPVIGRVVAEPNNLYGVAYAYENVT